MKRRTRSYSVVTARRQYVDLPRVSFNDDDDSDPDLCVAIARAGIDG